MTTKAVKNIVPMDSSKFLEMLSSISFEEIMLLKFRRRTTDKWEKMVFRKDPQKKLYVCNVCHVTQCGESVLFSHLSGKKHNAKMDSVKQLLRSTDSMPSKNISSNINIKPANVAQSLNKAKAKFQNPNNLKIALSNANKSVEIKNRSDVHPPHITEEPLPSGQTFIKRSSILKTKDVAKSTTNQQNNKLSSSDQVAAKPKSPANQISPEGNLNKPMEQKVVSVNSISLKNQINPFNQTTTSATNLIPAQSKPSNKSSNSGVVDSTIEAQNKTNDSPPENTASDIVKNPLAVGNINKKKIISCVPISELLGTKPAHLDKKSDNDVIIIDDTVPKNVDDKIMGPNENSRDFSNRCIIPVTVSDADRNETASIAAMQQGSTFESTTNPNEILGLVGVEYVIKIIKNLNDPKPRYLCSLCDITCDELLMHLHLIGYNHRVKYCDKHFPTALRQYRQYMPQLPERKERDIMMPILDKLAKAIETHHGREAPYQCYAHFYYKNRPSIVSKAFSRRHSSEMLGPTFSHVVDSKDVDKLIEISCQNTQQSQPPACYPMDHGAYFNAPYQAPSFAHDQGGMPNSYSNFTEPNFVQTVDDETHRRMVENFLKDTRKGQSGGHKCQARTSKRARSRSNSSERKKRRLSHKSTSQWNVERRSLSPLRDGDIWQAYRHMVNQKIRELNVFFELYKADPEEHPLYQEEWQKFWKRRKDELMAAGINHRTYNYQNEWILFFNARVEELYNQDVEDIKIKCRERLCLPMTNDELLDSKYHVHVSENVQHKVSREREPNDDAGVLKNRFEESEGINAIHVLRLLTAMEDHLGSLGPVITEMLAKALQAQKVNPNKINYLILTSENCAILETVREKFTGLIISKILDPAKERALKKAIYETDLLLKVAANMQNSPKRSSKVLDVVAGRVDPLQRLTKNLAGSSEKSDPIDKTELVAKLASSLISQGKTTINRDQLHQIIQVYSLIEKKKRQEAGDSTTESVSNSDRRSPTRLQKKKNEAPPVMNQEKLNENTNSNSSVPEPYQRIQMARYDPSRAASSMENFGGNFNAMNHVNNFNTNGNYYSANVARANNINSYNNFPNHQGFGPNSHPYEQFDSGQMTMNNHSGLRSNMNPTPPFFNSYGNSFNSRN